MIDELREWRDAREAIFAAQVTAKAGPELFDRLGRAEHALMRVARAIDSPLTRFGLTGTLS